MVDPEEKLGKMEVKYIVEEGDYLTLHLFGASKNPLVSKQRRTKLILLFLVYIIISYYFYTVDAIMFYTILVLAAIIIAADYFYFDKKKYVNLYRNNIRKNFKQKIGVEVTTKFDNELQLLTTSDPNLETKIKYSGFECIEELKDYYFIKIKSGERVIIPKRAITDPSIFERELSYLKNIKVDYINELSWKWK